ncbi:hypothetical protein ACBP95_08625 [Morganella morganii]|uniref:hypothetical protein n=1 Tax=Morganella morganii TaxID=582 RepID=UPI00352507AA
MNINNYHNIIPDISGTEGKDSLKEPRELAGFIGDISGIMRASGYDIQHYADVLSENKDDKYVLTRFFYELNEINKVLSDSGVTEEQALEILDKYNKLISDPVLKKVLATTQSELADKIKNVQDDIKYFFMKKEMVTFGYFVEKMDVASKYGHNISVRCYRDGFSQYTEFYKALTKLLSSYGEYSKGVIDDGKKTIFKQNLFYRDLHLALMKYYPVTGDLKNSDGENCSLYKGRFEIDTSKGMNNCSVYIDDELIDSGVNYNDAVRKMEYFFSVMKKPVSGTQVIKKINTETDSNGKLVKVVGMADVIAMPGALFRWLEISVSNEDYDKVNAEFDVSLETLKKFNFINDDYLSVSSSYKEILKKTSEIFNDKLKSSRFERIRNEINEERKLDHGQINSYNTIMDGIKKELQMTLDEFSQRYNTINSNYDNMLRVITTMISELTQELKGFLRI